MMPKILHYLANDLAACFKHMGTTKAIITIPPQPLTASKPKDGVQGIIDGIMENNLMPIQDKKMVITSP